MTAVREEIHVDDKRGVVYVPHWGITLRRLFGACIAAQNDPDPETVRQYTVRHKQAAIATINVKTHQCL